MLFAYRLTKAKYASTAFDGEGARLYGGRWNSVGTPVVYLASRLSLAALEILVHSKRPEDLMNYVYLKLEFEDSSVSQLDLPKDWQQSPAPISTQKLGDSWVKEKGSLLLEVPSVIIPEETNYLLNPAHSEFEKLKIAEARAFGFDTRLWK